MRWFLPLLQQRTLVAGGRGTRGGVVCLGLGNFHLDHAVIHSGPGECALPPASLRSAFSAHSIAIRRRVSVAYRLASGVAKDVFPRSQSSSRACVARAFRIGPSPWIPVVAVQSRSLSSVRRPSERSFCWTRLTPSTLVLDRLVLWCLTQHVVSASQLKIPAAAPNSRTLVICQGGEVDSSLGATFARESRSAGAVVNSCSPDVEYLCSQAREAAGTYDAVLVVWAGVEGSSGVVLGEVSSRMEQWAQTCLKPISQDLSRFLSSLAGAKDGSSRTYRTFPVMEAAVVLRWSLG